MTIALTMTVGKLRVFRLEARLPDSIANQLDATSSTVNSCLDLAEIQINEARELIGPMPIGKAPVVAHEFYVKKKEGK